VSLGVGDVMVRMEAGCPKQAIGSLADHFLSPVGLYVIRSHCYIVQTDLQRHGYGLPGTVAAVKTACTAPPRY